MSTSDKIKKPCKTCKKGKTIKLEPALYTKEEFDNVIEMIDKYDTMKNKQDYIFGFYNRVFGTNKRPGCSKCYNNISKSLKAKYQKLYSI